MKVAVIGCGNLGRSFLEGLVRSGALEPGNITASDPDGDRLEEAGELGVETTTSNGEAAEGSDVVFVAVKPGLVGEVLEEIDLPEDVLLVSLAAGVSTDHMGDRTRARLVRVMPNICGSIGEMASAYALGANATEEDGELVEDLLGRIGSVVEVEEGLMDAVTGLSGSGPAYVFIFIRALRDAGVELGLSEEEALELAARTVKGGGELVLESGEDLEDLIDVVCSPKGTTIEGVKVLEDEGVEEALREAVRAAAERSEELSR